MVGAVVGSGPRRLSTASQDRVDPVVRDLVERAREDGYAQGLAEGRTRGAEDATEAARQQVDALGRAVTAACQQLRLDAEAERDRTVAAATELALSIAAVVLGREPHDGGDAVAARVRATLDQLDDPAPVVRTSPTDVEVVAAAVADLRGVQIETDPRLQPGDARIDGGWARADLTTAAAFAAVRRELGVDR